MVLSKNRKLTNFNISKRGTMETSLFDLFNIYLICSSTCSLAFVRFKF